MKRLVGALSLAALLYAGTSAGATVLVRAGADLQAALDQARAGDVVLLEAGATFVGNFVLPARASSGEPIIVRSAATDPRLPAEMVRVRPDVADLLPKLRSPNGEPALRTATGARGWRLVLIEFLGNAGGEGDIVRLGDGGSAQTQLGQVPSDIIVDRCYLHGGARSGQKRGIALNSGQTVIQNSWISDIKVVGQDSQAIAGWNGPGPFRILNNYLEGGQGFMLGGSDPAIRGLVPTDITFTGNYVTRPVSWRGEVWQVKNLFELKNARNVWVDGNLFENNWRGAQAGYAILFTPRNQDGRSPWSTVEDVHFRYNVVRHVAGGVNILGHDSPNPSGSAKGIEISNNLMYDVDGGAWGGNGEFLLLGDGPSDVVVEHNTVLQSGNVLSAYGGSASAPAVIRPFVFRFNLVRHNAYGVHGDGRGVGNDTLAAYFPSAIFTGNVIAGGSAGQYPGGNSFPSLAAFDRYFIDPADGDYHLQASNLAKDGQAAAGADIDEVNRAWRAAQAGSFRDSPRFTREREPQRPDKRKGR